MSDLPVLLGSFTRLLPMEGSSKPKRVTTFFVSPGVQWSYPDLTLAEARNKADYLVEEGCPLDLKAELVMLRLGVKI